MKKNVSLLLSVLCLSLSGFSQFSTSDFTVGVAGNYTMYKGDFQQSTPGVKVEVGYGLFKKVGFSLAFTKGFPIKTASEVVLTNSAGSTQTSASEVSTKFSTISLNAQYRLVGNDESPLGIYLPFGASFVSAKYDNKPKAAIPAGYTVDTEYESGKESGATINLGLGAQYSIGMPIIFADAAVALPANKLGEQYVANYIPAHFIFNAGVRIMLGSREDY